MIYIILGYLLLLIISGGIFGYDNFALFNTVYFPTFFIGCLVGYRPYKSKKERLIITTLSTFAVFTVMAALVLGLGFYSGMLPN